MPRPGATETSEARVQTLVSTLFDGFDRQAESLSDLAEAADLGYETVRSLLRPPARQLRSGPGFLVVASIARARGVSLDEIAAQIPGLPEIRPPADEGARMALGDRGGLGG